jgi:SpoIIAA-like
MTRAGSNPIRGSVKKDHAMFTVEMDKAEGYLELTVDGHVGRADFDDAVKAVDTLLETHKRINVVEIVLALGWVEPEIWWKDIAFQLSHHKWLNRVAVVSDSGWIGPVTRLFAPLYPAAIRTFSCGEIEAARAWAKGDDGGDEESTEDAIDGYAPHA